MDRFRLGHASGGDWRQACEDCIAQISPLPPEANFGFLYVSDHFAGESAAILARLSHATAIRSWVGTSGLGVCATGREYFGEPAIVVLAAEFAEDTFTLFDLVGGGIEGFIGANRTWLDATPACFGIAHGDPRMAETMSLVPALAQATNAYLVGGLTSSASHFPQFAGGLTEGAVSGVLFSGDVAVATGLTQGCSPLGAVHEVTECQGNVVIALDGRPALDVLEEDIGEVLARDPSDIGNYIFAALPLQGSDRADYMVRNLTGLDLEERLVGVAEVLVEGQGLMFCRRDAEAAREDLKRMLADIRRRAGSAPRGALYCSCVARGPNMFGPGSAELRTIAEALGEIPLVGFFGNGEFCHDRLYTYTGVLSLFL